MTSSAARLFGFWEWQNFQDDQQERRMDNDLKVQIVAECADHENVQRCADEMKEALD